MALLPASVHLIVYLSCSVEVTCLPGHAQGGGGYLGQAGAGQAAASAQQYVLQQQLLGALTPQQSGRAAGQGAPAGVFLDQQSMRLFICPEPLIL